ncbi:MAG: SsrA-binding protein SmpB [Chlamydiota bacterium]
MKDGQKELVSNRKAFYDYEIMESFEGGIALQGTEIKSLRNHGGSLQDAYITIEKDELWLIHSSIAPYQFGSIHNHEERRKRKLLMHKHEISRLKKATDEKGLTLIPLALYLKKGIVKVRIAIAKGKKNYDKRADIKDKENKRMLQRKDKYEE